MSKDLKNVSSIAGKLVSKQTFLMLEDDDSPWQFGMRLAFGIQIYVEFSSDGAG